MRRRWTYNIVAGDNTNDLLSRLREADANGWDVVAGLRQDEVLVRRPYNRHIEEELSSLEGDLIEFGGEGYEN